MESQVANETGNDASKAWLATTDRLIGNEDLQQIVALDRQMIMKMVKVDAFPAPRISSRRKVLWLLSDVTHWMKNLKGEALPKVA